MIPSSLGLPPVGGVYSDARKPGDELAWAWMTENELRCPSPQSKGHLGYVWSDPDREA